MSKEQGQNQNVIKPYHSDVEKQYKLTSDQLSVATPLELDVLTERFTRASRKPEDKGRLLQHTLFSAVAGIAASGMGLMSDNPTVRQGTEITAVGLLGVAASRVTRLAEELVKDVKDWYENKPGVLDRTVTDIKSRAALVDQDPALKYAKDKFGMTSGDVLAMQKAILLKNIPLRSLETVLVELGLDKRSAVPIITAYLGGEEQVDRLKALPPKVFNYFEGLRQENLFDLVHLHNHEPKTREPLKIGDLTPSPTPTKTKGTGKGHEA